MADKNKKDIKDAAATAGGARPIRPFVLGFGIAAAWGAMNMPMFFSFEAVGEFTAEIVAIAIAAGGVLAALIEVLILVFDNAAQVKALFTRRL